MRGTYSPPRRYLRAAATAALTKQPPLFRTQPRVNVSSHRGDALQSVAEVLAHRVCTDADGLIGSFELFARDA